MLSQHLKVTPSQTPVANAPVAPATRCFETSHSVEVFVVHPTAGMSQMRRHSTSNRGMTLKRQESRELAWSWSSSTASRFHGRLVVDFGYSVSHLLLVLGFQLRLAEIECQLVDGSGKAEGRIIGKVHWRTRVESDVEALVGGHEKRNGVLHRLAVDLFAIHGQHAGTALADAGAIVFEVEDYGVLALAKRRASPPETLQVQHVVNEDRPASAYLRYVGNDRCNQPERSDQHQCIPRPGLPASVASQQGKQQSQDEQAPDHDL